MTTSRKREKIIETALTLFCRDGFHATGIDRIVQESGVAKMTLYNHFKCKEELILTVLRRKDELWRNWFRQEVEGRSQDPKTRILTIFDCLHESIQETEFNGCLFSLASQEYPEEDNPIRAAAAEHKRLVKVYIVSILESLKVREPAAIACKISIVIEGVLSEAQVSNNAQAALNAKEIVELLLDNSQHINKLDAA